MSKKADAIENEQAAPKSADPLLECLVFLTAHYGRAKSAGALVAGLAYDPAHPLKPQLFCEAAQRIGLKAGIVKRSTIASIHQANLPCIIITGKKNALVLMGQTERSVQFFDPETNSTRDVSCGEIDAIYSGYCIFVHPQPEFLNPERAEQKSESPARHWFWSVVEEGRSVYAFVMLASVFINLFVLVSPLFIMNVYDRVIPNNAIETGWALGLGALCIFVFDFIIRTIRGYLIDLSGRRIDVIAGRRIYDQVLNMKLAGRPKSSGVFANMLKDFDSVREFFTSASITILVDLPFTLLFIFVIYQLAGSLAFVVLALILIVLASSFVLQFPLKKLVRQSARSAEAKHGMLVETIHGLETIKSIGADGRFRARYGDYIAENALCGQSSRFISALSGNIATFLQQIASIILVLFGMYMVKDGDLSVGGLIAAVLLGGRAIAPVGQMANLMTRYHQAGGALKTLEKLMAQPIERPVEKQFLHRPDLSGALSFEKVGFAYPSTDHKVLDAVSFSIKAGERVGLIGRVGSGKSTIAKILMGLYEPLEGAVFLDNTDHRQIDPADLRRSLGYIAQDVFLFSGSVRDNIAAGKPDASEAQILDAAKRAGVHDFIARHPMGYDAQVGEHGNALSGGQKQAIALARAILMRPKILLCDEPTNAMDVQAEQSFLRYLEQELKDTSVLLITHKASMLPVVNRLILMDQGKIVMDGPRDLVLDALKTGQVKAGL